MNFSHSGGGGGQPVDKLYKMIFCSDANCHEEYTRRGSRGSILSGKANVEDPKPLTISAHQLAQLGLSASPDCVRLFRNVIICNVSDGSH